MAYAPGDTLIRAVMTASSGLPADQVVNDFAFSTGIDPSADPEGYAATVSDLFTAVDAFYRNARDGAGTALGRFISDAVDRAATHQLEAYKIVAGDMGSPTEAEPWLGPVTMAADQTGLPRECAAVLSYHADLTAVGEAGGSGSIPSDESAIDQGAPATHTGTTKPRARRRGRLYFGPLITAAIDTAPPYLLSAAFTLTLRREGSALLAAAAAADCQWCVWSRRDQVLRPVIGGWTDNAPDIQRRRGALSSARVTFT